MFFVRTQVDVTETTTTNLTADPILVSHAEILAHVSDGEGRAYRMLFSTIVVISNCVCIRGCASVQPSLAEVSRGVDCLKGEWW